MMLSRNAVIFAGSWAAPIERLATALLSGATM
jgi:hypothetical protein